MDDTRTDTRIGDLVRVESIPDDYMLITDSQDITATLETIGVPDAGYGLLFARLGEAEYLEVWASEYSVPYLSRIVERIY